MNKGALSPWKKLGYGVGDISQTTGFTMVSFFFLFFLTDAVGLDPRLAGYVLLIGKAWDAITDPAMGIISDRSASRFGRRRIFMFWGAFPYALTFILLWLKPDFLTGSWTFAYYTLVFLLHSTSLTITIVPYNALSAELTQDYNERTNLFSYRMAFSIFFGLVAAALPPLVRNSQADRMWGYFLMGLTFAGLILLPIMITVFTTREKFKASPDRIRGVKPALRALWENKAFRIAVLVFLLSWMTLDVVAATMEYYVTYVVGLQHLLPAILATLFIAATLFLPVVSFLSQRFGKPNTYIAAMIFWIIVLFALLFIPAGAVFPLFLVAGLSGFGVAAIHVVPYTLAADVVEVDEQLSGERREGMYFGILTFSRKVATGVGLFLLGNILSYSGYVSGTEQPDSARLAIRTVIVFLPAVFLLVASWIASRYPLTDAKHAAIVEELEARREPSVYV